MKFTKMHGLGNDYVYVNCMEEMLENPSQTAIQVSDRHFGIGGDGLILIAPSEVADFQMIMYNADGSRGEMCGNGIRCVAKYVYEYGLTDQTTIRIETLGGIKELVLTVCDGKVEKIRVNMGQPILVPTQVPVDVTKLQETAGGQPVETVISAPIQVDGSTYKVTCVSMGNPHAVLFVDDVDHLDLRKIGPSFENHPAFPNRINTEFVRWIDRTHLQMRVWERGSGETLACGTGTCATVVAAVLNGLTEREVTVHLRGGDLEIFWDPADNCVYMTGPATVVFDGEIAL